MATLTDIYDFVSTLHPFQWRCLRWMMGPIEQPPQAPDFYGLHDVCALDLAWAMIPASGPGPDPVRFAAGLAMPLSAYTRNPSAPVWRGLSTIGIQPAGYTDFYSRMFAAFYGKVPAPGSISSDGPTSAAFKAFYATFFALRGDFASYSYPPGQITELDGTVRTSNSVAVGGFRTYPPG